MLALRVSLGLLLIVWGFDKLFVTPHGQAVFHFFYGVPLGSGVVRTLGVAEVALGLAIALGFWRKVAYGLGLLLHAVTVLVTWRAILYPWADSTTLLFFSGVPILGGFIALYGTRHDPAYTLDAALAARRLRR